MKTKIIPLAGGLFLMLVSSSFASFATKEAPVGRAGTAITVSVSTSAWTKSNTAASHVAQRAAYRVTNPTGNSAAMYAVCDDSAPSSAITVLINEIQTGSNITMPCGPGLDLYLLSVHTSAENAHVWEIGQ